MRAFFLYEEFTCVLLLPHIDLLFPPELEALPESFWYVELQLRLLQVRKNSLPNAYFRIQKKKYFIIDQQIARHFEHLCSERLSAPFPFMQLKQLTLFLIKVSQPIMIKG